MGAFVQYLTGLLLERKQEEARAQAVAAEILRLLPKDLPMPAFKVVDRPGSRWLGQCLYHPGEDNTTITLQRYIMGDETTLKRIVAHELCHHAEFLISWFHAKENGIPPHAWTRFYLNTGGAGHGTKFQEWADKMNAAYGAGYVSEKSDEQMVKQPASHDMIVALLKRGTQLMWQHASRPSARQKRYLQYFVLEHAQDGKVVYTREVDLAHGAPIGGDAWSYTRNGAINEKLQQLWDGGRAVPIEAPPGVKRTETGWRFTLGMAGEKKESAMRELIRGLEETTLDERNDVSSDPYDRARERMMDAQDRGGWVGMIDATLRRVKATFDRDKLGGIIDVATDMKKKLDLSDERQARRAKQLDGIIAAAKRKLGEAVEMRELLRALEEAKAAGRFSEMSDRALDDAIMNCLEGPEGVYMDGEYTGPIAPRMRQLRKHYRELSPQQQDDLYNRVKDCL